MPRKPAPLYNQEPGLPTPEVAEGANTCTEEKLSNNEFQKTIVKMINKLKEETQKLIFDLKEDMKAIK
jgi:hypothetical protein